MYPILFELESGGLLDTPWTLYSYGLIRLLAWLSAGLVLILPSVLHKTASPGITAARLFAILVLSAMFAPLAFGVHILTSVR